MAHELSGAQCVSCLGRATWTWKLRAAPAPQLRTGCSGPSRLAGRWSRQPDHSSAVGVGCDRQRCPAQSRERRAVRRRHAGSIGGSLPALTYSARDRRLLVLGVRGRPGAERRSVRIMRTAVSRPGLSSGAWAPSCSTSGCTMTSFLPSVAYHVFDRGRDANAPRVDLRRRPLVLWGGP